MLMKVFTSVCNHKHVYGWVVEIQWPLISMAHLDVTLTHSRGSV